MTATNAQSSSATQGQQDVTRGHRRHQVDHSCADRMTAQEAAPIKAPHNHAGRHDGHSHVATTQDDYATSRSAKDHPRVQRQRT